MTYPDPTNEQMFVIAVAVMVPLVWAFTHHGKTRMAALILWIPTWLYVARVTYMNHSPAAPLETRLKWALIEMFMDPMMILWPAFVLLTFGLIHLFTAHRQRREAHARSAAASESLSQQRLSERSAEAVPGPVKRCLGCSSLVRASTATCPYCQYRFAPSRILQAPAQAVSDSTSAPPDPQPPSPRERIVVVADAVVVERIRMLGALRDDGLLTEEEFLEKKAVLLSAWPHPADAPRPTLESIERTNTT